MTTPLTLPLADPPASAHVDADALVLVGRPLREGAAPVPRFAQDTWNMEAGYHLPNHHKGQSTILFEKIEDPLWRLTMKEYAYSRLIEVTEGCTRLPAVVTVCREAREMRHLIDYLTDRHPGMRLRNLSDDTILDAYLEHRIDGGRTAPGTRVQERQRVKWFLTLLFRTRASLTYDALERLPWDGRSSQKVAGTRPEENTTRRIPPQVLAPFLRGALFYVHTASKDILAALAEQERLRQPLNSGNQSRRHAARRRLEAFIEDRRTAGRGMPARAEGWLPRMRDDLDAGVNRHLVGQLTGVGKSTLDHPDSVALIRQAAAELGLEEGGMDTEISPDPETGRPWRPYFGHKSLLWEARMLVAACYVVTVYLSGLRDSEAQGLRPGCHFVEPSEDGVVNRHKLRGTVFKGREAAGEEDTWVVIEPVAQAVAVLEAMTDCDRLFYRHGFRYKNEGIGTSINHHLDVFRDRLGQVRPHDPIPLVDGTPWRFTTRQFRRTVAWHIAHQPFGVVAGKIQYKHAKVAMFEGYAGYSASGFRAEIETEGHLARLEHFLDQYEDFKAGVKLPDRLAAEFSRVREELGDFPGHIAETARLRAMLANPARSYYPGVLNDCYFEASTALCLSRRPAADPAAAPVMNHCQPAKCPNSCVLPQHRPAIDGAISGARQLLSIRPLSDLQKTALHQEIGNFQRMRDQSNEAAQ